MDADDFLEHFGIKGMKWGVTRKEGPDGEVGSIHKPPKNSGDGIGSKDRTLKKGSEILNVTDRKFKEGKSDRIYSSYTKNDKATYSDLIAGMGDSGKVYHNTFQIKKDIKIPSDQKAAEVFQKMVKDNPTQVSKDMAAAYKARVGIPLRTEKYFNKKISELDGSNKEVGEKLYKRYNQSLVVDMQTSKDFYGRLAKEGYGALSDLNDRNKMSQDPLIVFHPDKNLSGVKSVPLSPKDVKSYMDYSMSKDYKKERKNLDSVIKR